MKDEKIGRAQRVKIFVTLCLSYLRQPMWTIDGGRAFVILYGDIMVYSKNSANYMRPA